MQISITSKRLSLTALILVIASTCFAESPELVPIKIEISTAFHGTATWDWWQVRTAYVPGSQPKWITTMSETGKSGTHIFMISIKASVPMQARIGRRLSQFHL